MAWKQRKTKPTKATEAGPDAREIWTPFQLPPVSLETPLGWHPQIADWTAQSSRVRWESLTTTPLEVNWIWRDAEACTLSERERRRLAEGFKREVAGAEKQARSNGVALQWKGEACGLRSAFDLEDEGQVREYTWNGLPGSLVVVALAGKGRLVFVSMACCPPASCRDPRAVIRRIVRSLRLMAAGSPLRVVLPGLEMNWPAEWRLDGVRGREGHIYLDAQAKGKRLGLARLGLAEWHASNGSFDKAYASLAKILFDRNEPGAPVRTNVGNGGKEVPSQTVLGRAEEKDPASSGIEVSGHAGALFKEQRRFHIRWGDSVVRLLMRKHAGAAAVLTWHCPESHALWALSARCGKEGAEALAREMLDHVYCHAEPNPAHIDWSGYIADEARPQPGDDAQNALTRGKPSIQNAAAWRRTQLSFRVRSLAEVRLEPSSKDGTADLVYEGSAANTFLARALRGGRSPERAFRRLSLDVIGRRTWEALAEGPSVSQLLETIGRQFAVHPVEFFPKLLAFLKMLGERRLVEAVDDGRR